MDNLLKKIEKLKQRFLKAWELLDIDSKKEKIKDLNLIINKPNFWNNKKIAIEISKEAEELEKENNLLVEMKQEINDLEELTRISVNEDGGNILDELEKKYKEIYKKFKKIEFIMLFSGKYDKNNTILSIHAGTGGVDAQDWAQILERMFLRFAENRKWETKILDRTVGNEAGIKNVTIKINGQWSYGNLRSEAGVHRLVRISPFDAESMRHTSFALVEIIPELPEAENLEIKEEDLKIDTFRSSGPGGQGVNTTDSAIRILHKPSKITVTCQNERSQHQNKETALKILKSKLYKLQTEEKEKKELKLRGETQKAEWGKQIRSYVMQPYKMVKDHRTNCETQNIEKILDGNLDEFIKAYLHKTCAE